MSIMHCDKHDVNYDTDFVETCFKCESDEFEKIDEDEAMEREHDREIESDKQAVERDLERLSDNFGNAGRY